MNENSDSLTDTSGLGKRSRSAQAVSRSKTDVKFWQGRIFKPVYTRADGAKVQAANYAAQIAFRSRRIRWSLETPNKEAAAVRAKEIYLFLVANGWEAALERYRPRAIPRTRPSLLTVGEFLSAVEATGQLSAVTFADYRQAFRQIVAQIAGIPGSSKKR